MFDMVYLTINEMKIFIGQQRKERISNKRHIENTTDMYFGLSISRMLLKFMR